jgi:hypothetical protein
MHHDLQGDMLSCTLNVKCDLSPPVRLQERTEGSFNGTLLHPVCLQARALNLCHRFPSFSHNALCPVEPSLT